MASFIPNPNLLAELERDATITEERHKAAERIAATAQQIAPVGTPDEPDDNPGQFRASIHAEGTSVVSDDPAAAFIIFGTSRTPAHDTFMRAAEMEGLKPVRQ